MNRQSERSVVLDISSDIVVLGIILAVIQVVFYKSFGPKQLGVLTSFLACSTIWKLISPFTETQTSWNRYIHVVLFVVGSICLTLILIAI